MSDGEKRTSSVRRSSRVVFRAGAHLEVHQSLNSNPNVSSRWYSVPLRCRLDPVSAEDISHGLIGNGLAEIGQGSDDAELPSEHPPGFHPAWWGMIPFSPHHGPQLPEKSPNFDMAPEVQRSLIG